MTETDHARLLLAILDRRWDEAEALVRRDPVDPQRFYDLCLQADLPTWLHVLLSDANRLDLVGPEVADRLAVFRKKIRADNMLLLGRAEQAIELLAAAGITPVALKGLDLLHRVYGSIDERILDDVDLLIRPGELPAAIAALEHAGWHAPPDPQRTHYIRSSHHLPLCSPGPIGVEFELHWNLAQEMRYAIDSEGLIDRALPLEVGSHRILRLDDHDHVAHQLLHHFTHYFDRRVKWAVDLNLLARAEGFEWERVVSRIREWGATAACGMSLQHLKKLFPGWIPDSMLRALPVAAWRRLLALPLRSPHPLDLYRATRRRPVQLYLAAVALERPSLMPRWLAHRALRDRHPTDHPLDS